MFFKQMNTKIGIKPDFGYGYAKIVSLTPRTTMSCGFFALI